MISNESRIAERLEVQAINEICGRLYALNFGRPHIASQTVVEEFLKEAAGAVAGHKFSPHFLLAEWEEVVDAWQLETRETYRYARRLGRKTRLPEKQRVMLWAIFECTRAYLKARNLITHAALFSSIASHLVKSDKPPFDFTIVDEAQDVSIPQLRFLAAMGSGRPNGLFFTGDLGHREEEIKTVGKWLTDRISTGVAPHEIGVFVRSSAELSRGRLAVETAGSASRYSTKRLKQPAVTSRSARCILPKAWNSAPLSRWPAMMRQSPLQERIETAADD